MSKAPKQWQLSTEETITSFNAWKGNLLYHLSLDSNFSPFLEPDFVWTKGGNRGLTADGEDVPANVRKTATQKKIQLELFLGQIANFCPVISRNTIIKTCTSLESIWEAIRAHYGLQKTGSSILDFMSFQLQPNERHEDLFQRLMAFVEDNLMTTGSDIKHHGKEITNDEEMTPTIENIVVSVWLHLIHPSLPKMVKQKYATELRNKSISSIKQEISLSLNSLLEEMNTIDDVSKVCRMMPFTKKQPSTCWSCHKAGRRYDHASWECKYKGNNYRHSRGAAVLEEECDPEPERCAYQNNTTHDTYNHDICAVDIVQSPCLNVYYGNKPVKLTLDTGATTSLMRTSIAQSLNIQIKPASQLAKQADGITPLKVIGEVHCILTRGEDKLKLDALVVDRLDTDVLAGTNFICSNDISIRLAKKQITIGSTYVEYEGAHGGILAARRSQSYVLKAPAHQSVVLPGDYVEVLTPADVPQDTEWAIEPRFDSSINAKIDAALAWPAPHITTSVGHGIRLTNTTKDPIVIKRYEHFCQIRPIIDAMPAVESNQSVIGQACKPTSHDASPFSVSVAVDPHHMLSLTNREKFHKLHLKYDNVFNPEISKYNGASGPIEATVNMGPTLPPQRKGRLPQYNRSTMKELQEKFDELEHAGVFAKPEKLGINVEYLNISFLIKKPNGGSRLVTSFGEVASYSKPQPSLMPNVDNVLRDLARWQYIIISDLHHAFYQVPLAHSSMKYCGVATPYKGIRIYTRSAMGMPGSETCLEELMSRVLGHLVEEGCVAKLADDLYCGGNTPEEALHNWSRVLEALSANNLRLSAHKTTICPKTAIILGWVWSGGSLSASPHKLSALSTVSPPTTIQGLRSFIGAYKVLSRVLRGYADYLQPLEAVTSGRASQEKIVWSSDLQLAFQKAQAVLNECKTITMPRPNDILWIVTDAAVKCNGIGATMYCLRNGDLKLAGFFNAKLKKHQTVWLPCELEALCIGAAVRHFSPFVIQSSHQCQVLTDSRPCVQACGKLKRGEFSASSRVSTFLSIISRYNVQVRHISGASNLPSDYTSRNPAVCPTPSTCQVCKFINELQDSVVQSCQSDSVQNVLRGSMPMPFTSRAAWLATQQECPDMRRTCAHLSQGTRPSKKCTTLKDVKRYLGTLTISHDGLLVAREVVPFIGTKEKIAVPRPVLHGLLVALHIRFSHPSRYQLKQLFTRYFYALDVEKAITNISDSCVHCSSLKHIPPALKTQSSEPPPSHVGTSYAADVLRRSRQAILVLRETTTSYTLASFISRETHTHLRDALLKLCAQLRSPNGPRVTIRIDAAPGLVKLQQDPSLLQYDIHLEVGHVKNINKNPVAERAIQELEQEILHLQPGGGAVNELTLAIAISQLNSRIRQGGLSSLELWTQRDQLTGEQVPIVDKDVIQRQHSTRVANHPHSAYSKLRGHRPSNAGNSRLRIGDLVFLKHERDKGHARDKYMVVSININAGKCEIRKFTNNQFRRKKYLVSLSDCFPVVSNLLSPLKPVDSSSDEEDDIYRQKHDPGIGPEFLGDNGQPEGYDINNDRREGNVNYDIPEDETKEVSETDVDDDDDDQSVNISIPDDIAAEPYRRSTRSRDLPKRFSDYVMDEK